MTLVFNTPTQIEHLCNEVRAAPFIGLDTEFVRERTYYAQLALIQIALPTKIVLVDPLAVDIRPLGHALKDGPITLVHAGRQDLELLLQETGVLPSPLFDTQIAAALVGHDEQIGYGPLVQKLLGITLAKDATRTNWAARPLTPHQCQYAEDDVRYLDALYQKLAAALTVHQRRAWLEEETAQLTDPGMYHPEPDQLLRRYRQGVALPQPARNRFGALLLWREATAQKVNLPRAWVIADPVLVDLALHPPTHIADLANRRGLDTRAINRFGEDLLRVCTDSHSEYRWPSALLDAEEDRIYKELVQLVDTRAKTLGIAASLIASRKTLKEIAQGAPPGPLARTWRAQVLGESGQTLLSAAARSHVAMA